MSVTTALAHDVSVSRGTLLIRPDVLQMELMIPADDLLHYYRPESDARRQLSSRVLDPLIEKYGERVVAQLIIRDGDGRRLAPRLIFAGHNLTADEAWDYETVRRATAKYRVEYRLAKPLRYLTLQQTFFGDGPAHAGQLALDVSSVPDQPGMTVTLTNRGNAETLEIAWPDAAVGSQPAPPDDGHATSNGAPRVSLPDRFKSVLADLSIEGAEVRLDIRLPLTLLETWLPVDRGERDALSAAEQVAAQEPIRRFFAGRNEVLLDGQKTAPEVIGVRMLGPDESRIVSPAAPDHLGALCARVGVAMRYRAESAPRQVDLTWDLFNGAVFEAKLNLSAAGQTSERLLTAYSPKLHWSLTNQP